MTRTAFNIIESRRLYMAGYDCGYRHGEADARLTDNEFLDTVVRRVRAADDLEDQVQQSIKATIAGLTAEGHRQRMTGGVHR